MEPFFTTKPLEKGTGMGLSVVHGIVTGLDGRIEIGENLPTGAVLDVFLPLYRGPGGEAETEEIPSPDRGKNECILFVDDEADLVAIAEDSLAGMGYRVVGFGDGTEALDWFRDHIQVPDLMISDVTMPGLPGDRLTQEVLELRPDLPVILITGASDRVTDAKVREIGAAALLHKPMILKEIAAVIRRVLDKG